MVTSNQLTNTTTTWRQQLKGEVSHVGEEDRVGSVEDGFHGCRDVGGVVLAPLVTDLLKLVQVSVGGNIPHVEFRRCVLLGEDGQAVGIAHEVFESVQFRRQGWSRKARDEAAIVC